MKKWKFYGAPIAIFCFALIVRIVYNLTVAKGYIPEYDAREYNSIGLSFLQTNCYCTTNRAPLWPYIISFIYFIMGYDTIYPRLFFSFLGSGTCVIIYFLVKDLFDKKCALIIGFLAAIYTGLFIYDGWMYTESLYTFLLTAFAYALYRLQHVLLQPSPGSLHFQGIVVTWQADTAKRFLILLCGFCLALATLTRPNGVLFFGLVVIWALILTVKKKISWQAMTQCILAAILIGTLIIAPWTYRNYRETGTFILIASGGGNVLSGVYNDTVLKKNRMGLGMWMPWDLISPPVDLHGHHCCDYTGDKDNTEYAIHWVETHLQDMPYLLRLHFINMWTPYTSEDGLPMREFPHTPLVKNRVGYDEYYAHSYLPPGGARSDCHLAQMETGTSRYLSCYSIYDSRKPGLLW